MCYLCDLILLCYVQLLRVSLNGQEMLYRGEVTRQHKMPLQPCAQLQMFGQTASIRTLSVWLICITHVLWWCAKMCCIYWMDGVITAIYDRTCSVCIGWSATHSFAYQAVPRALCDAARPVSTELVCHYEIAMWIPQYEKVVYVVTSLLVR